MIMMFLNLAFRIVFALTQLAMMLAFRLGVTFGEIVLAAARALIGWLKRRQLASARMPLPPAPPSLPKAPAAASFTPRPLRTRSRRR